MISIQPLQVIAFVWVLITLPSWSLTGLKLEKFRSVITTEFKHYRISPAEEIQLYGAKHRKFLSPTLYWGEAGYGALFGKRSGYLEGGIFLGHMNTHANTILDYRIFIGAGGGGSAPQGGGFIVHPTMGLGTPISSNLFLMGELGYIHFVNGDISSVSVAVSINMNMWTIRERTFK